MFTEEQLQRGLSTPSIFDDWPTIEKIAERMSLAEHSVSHFNKLTGQQMCREIQDRLDQMKALALDLPEKWPEFSTLAASIRGYSFNAFRITAEIAEKQGYRRRSEEMETPRFHLRKPKTIDDLL